MLYPKSAILGLSFLDPKDLCLPNQFSRGSLQKRSASTYLIWCQRRDWVASMIEFTLIFNLSYVCHTIWTFLASIFCNVSLAFLNRIQPIRKVLRSHENIWSMADISGVNIGFYSNSRDWLFWIFKITSLIRMFMMSKINPLVNKQKRTVLTRLVNMILYLHKK